MEHRIVLIGHGGISEAYVRAAADRPNARICGVVGRNAEKAQAFAEKHGIEYHGVDLKTVANCARATAVIICTPNAAHYEGVMAASSLGLHCLCEKPLHISPEQQLEMIDSCKANNVKLAVSYMRRFTPHLLAIKSMIDSGTLGRIKVVDVKIKHYRPAEYYNSWHGTEATDGGGPFIQQGSHIIDLALWLCGGYHEVVQASRFQVMHSIEVEDHGYAVLRYANGAIGMIEASTACVGWGHESIEITGDKGTITANFQGITHFGIPDAELPVFPTELTGNAVLMRRLVDDFLLSIEEDREPFVSGESGKTATELVMDIYGKAGAPVRMFSKE